MSIQIRSFIGKKIHMIGIGGSSMSGLAQLLQARGYTVSGSDNYESYLVAKVRDLGIPVTIGHRAENVQGADLVIFSAAISEENPERHEAFRLGIPQMERSELLGQMMAQCRHSVGVSGTHGKTTTTAMLSQMLVEAGVDPSVHLGGSFDFIGGGTRLGGEGLFVAEACEFHSSFLEMRPTVAVVLNIQEDHLDYYKDLDDITRAFGKFISLVPPDGTFVGNGDDERVRLLMKTAACHCVTYGTSPDCDWQIDSLHQNEDGTSVFDACLHGKKICTLTLHVPGDFNRLNALAALAAAHALHADPEACARGLSEFRGVHRRLEWTGTVDGVRLYHDYGHNPVEMRGALSVMKQQKHNRLWAVMQPHTYSRVKSLFADYIHCCEDADEILITDIYAAREKDPGDVRSEMLVDAIEKTGQSVHLTHTFDDTERYLRAHWQDGDLVLTMGCGNINVLNDQIARNGDTVKK